MYASPPCTLRSLHARENGTFAPVCGGLSERQFAGVSRHSTAVASNFRPDHWQISMLGTRSALLSCDLLATSLFLLAQETIDDIYDLDQNLAFNF